MSKTCVYSELEALDVGAGESLDRAPKILDWDSLKAWGETRSEFSAETFENLLVTEGWTDREAYPEETWKLLHGFKTWKPADAFLFGRDPDLDAIMNTLSKHETRSSGPTGYSYNIKSVGVCYEGKDGLWKTMLRDISEYTEPFAVYQSPVKNRFPDVTDFRDGRGSVYYIECVDGGMYAEERTFEQVETDPFVTDIEPVID